MRIAWLEPPSLAVQGDQMYRTVQPCQSLARLMECEVVAGHWLQPPMHQAAETADVLVLCQAVDIDFLALMARRKQAGRTTLVEINDNFLETRAFGDVGSFYHHESQTSLVMQLAARADGLVVSTPYLAELFGHLNDALLVLPNSLDLGPDAGAADQNPPDQSGPIRLGWAGSAGHAPDVAVVMPALRTLLHDHAHLTLCIMAPAALHPLFAWVPKERLDLRPATGLQGYLDFIATWDIGLAPLIDTPFNRGRSDVKFLEYTAGSAATVASRGPAYHTIVHNQTGVLVDDVSEFATAVTALIDAPRARARLVAEARHYVAAHRSHARAHPSLARFVRAHAPTSSSAEAQSSRDWHRQIVAGRNTACSGRFSYLTCTPAETGLFEALRAQQGAGDARPMALVQQSLPGCYLPHLYAGASCTEATLAMRHLEEAQRLAPHSAAVVHHLTHARLRMGDAGGAVVGAEKHLAGHPLPWSYAPLWELLATAHGAISDGPAQARALARAHGANPAYGPPARALAALILAAEAQLSEARVDIEALVAHVVGALVENLVGLRPDYADAYFLGRLAGRSGSWGEATKYLTQALAMADAQRRVDGAQLCLAWLAKAALSQGDLQRARGFLQQKARRNARPRAPASVLTQ